MYKPLFIFPSVLRSKSPNGQLQRNFIQALFQDTYRPIVICLEGDISVSTLPPLRYIIIKQSRFLGIIESCINRLGLMKFFNVPDFFRFSYVKEATRIAKKICKEEKIDFVHTISFPSSAHLVGLKLNRLYGIPWIAQFYDPWLNNPHRPVSKIIKWYDKRLERSVAENATLLAPDSNLFVEQWVQRYESLVENKIVNLPLTTSFSEHVEYSKHTDKVIFSHIGNLYKERSSLDFIKAVHSHLQRKPKDRDRLLINYVGKVPDSEKEMIKKLGIDDVFNLVGIISEDECLKYYSVTDVFIAIDVNIRENIFFPSKLLRYLYYKKPILGITTEVSVLADELKSAGHSPFLYGDFKGIENYIDQAINNYENLTNFDKSYGEQYSINNVLKYYYSLVDKYLL